MPPGRLSAGQGQRDAHALDWDQVRKTVESIHSAVVAAWTRLEAGDDNVSTEGLEIGFVGVGNRGKDSLLVLVEAGDMSRAWGLVVQTKQCLAAEDEYETVSGILKAMHSDLKDTHTLPQLPTDWVTWQKQARAGAALPEVDPSGAAWDEDDCDQRVIYGFISDRLFSDQQENIRQKLVSRQHPWNTALMRRVLIVSQYEQACWHSRTGALLRYIRAAAQKNKKFRNGLRWVYGLRQLSA